MLSEFTHADGIDVLARMRTFARARQEVILHDVANVSTPGFRPVDVDVDGFRASLREAVERRRAERTGRITPLRQRSTRDVRIGPGGDLELRPTPEGAGLLFHDGNDRDIIDLMRDLNENALVFRQSVELLRQRYSMLETAIRERV